MSLTDLAGRSGCNSAVSAVQSVIFDFDYTLADSSEGVIECANYALARLGLPAAPDDAIRQTIGLSLPHTLTTLAGEQYAELGDEFTEVFFERARVIMTDASLVYEFVPPLLGTLRSRNITLGIVSSGRRRRISAVLQRYDLHGSFSIIVGSEDVETMKPDPTGLLRAVKALNTPKESCLYVGDSLTDAETARCAGVGFVAVMSGVTGRDAFAEYEPLMVLENAAELPANLHLDAVSNG